MFLISNQFESINILNILILISILFRQKSTENDSLIPSRVVACGKSKAKCTKTASTALRKRAHQPAHARPAAPARRPARALRAAPARARPPAQAQLPI